MRSNTPLVWVIDSVGGALRVDQKGDVQGRVPEHDPVHGSCDHSVVVEGVLLRIALAQRSKDNSFDLTSRRAGDPSREPQSAEKGFDFSERQVLRFSDGPARQVSFVHVEPVSEVHVFPNCYSPPFIREDENEG